MNFVLLSSRKEGLLIKLYEKSVGTNVVTTLKL
jgi:hypothetical protein